MTNRIRILALLLLIAITLASCAPKVSVSQPAFTKTPKPQPSTTFTVTSVPMELALYRSPEIPDVLVVESDHWGIPLVPDPDQAPLQLELASAGNEASIASKSTWIYALVAPFPTVVDGVTLEELQAAWNATSTGPLANSPLWMTESTQAAFTALWGDPNPEAVKNAPADKLLETLWENQPSFGIVPFEALTPKLKVLLVEGQAPIHNDFIVETYPLKIDIALRSLDREPATISLALPDTNRDPTRLTTVIMTGVTALVRATAYIMETKGVMYPGRDIRNFMRAADITHISNEIPFFTGCEFPNPSRTKLIFCSDPKYIELLQDVGTDVVELTGNHFADYGPDAMIETLDIYARNEIPYYGGGADLEDSQKPLLLTHNGNQIAFIGCNPVDLGRPPVATEYKPGAAPCSHKYLVNTIKDLDMLGYLVIATFQHQEYYSPEARPDQLEDFHRVADAGASIVSGSQAHFPQMMEFYDDSFIHYGLGNLFFDQMGDIPYYPGIRREFIDRYTIYNGQLISVELLTMMLEDHSRPRPMTSDERTSFLNEYFFHSGWSELIPTPIPLPTVTLTPMMLPHPFTTITPVPR